MIYPDNLFNDYLIPEPFQGNCLGFSLVGITTIHSLLTHKTKTLFPEFHSNPSQTGSINSKQSTGFFAPGHSRCPPLKIKNTTHCLSKRKTKIEEKMPPRWQNRLA